MRARGLKLTAIIRGIQVEESRPMRARGLKLPITLTILAIAASRPMRARGLKHLTLIKCNLHASVAPHAGAWIETKYVDLFYDGAGCRAPCGRVD